MGTTGSRAWTRYCQLLVEKPILSKGLTGGCLFAGGDLLAQKIDGTLESDAGYDPRRTVRGFFWSAVCFTPVGHGWYMNVLNRYLPGTATADVLKKVALDQLIFGPIVNGSYLAYSTVSQGGDVEDVKKKLRAEYVNVVTANWTVWPAIQLVNFRFVPPPLQMPVMNVAVFFWSCYLAVVGARKNHLDPEHAVHTEVQVLSVDHVESHIDNTPHAKKA